MRKLYLTILNIFGCVIGMALHTVCSVASLPLYLATDLLNGYSKQIKLAKDWYKKYK